MANAYKCDRCGVFFEEYKSVNKYPLVAKEWVHGSNRFYHLCEKCHEDLKLFMENAPLVVNKEEDTIYADGVPVNRPMTCREKLAIEHPECVNENCVGGCFQCPCDYGYAGRPSYCYDGDRCADCWDRPVEE